MCLSVVCDVVSLFDFVRKSPLTIYFNPTSRSENGKIAESNKFLIQKESVQQIDQVDQNSVKSMQYLSAIDSKTYAFRFARLQSSS